MQAQKLQVKVFVEPGSNATPEMFVPVFHDWIKHRVLPELLVDVANYAHVPKGPGVVLIGHHSDYSMDEADGRLGLLHNRKRAAPGSADQLSDVFRRALHATTLLERDPALAGKVRFSPGEFLFRINDRLAAPNTDATFAALQSELETLSTTLFAGPFELARVGDPKSLFSVRMVSGVKAELPALLGRLGGPPS